MKLAHAYHCCLTGALLFADDGVLGGFGQVSKPDIQDSRQFLLKAFGAALQEAAEGKRHLVALDCGAGVGRVTEHLLLHFFQEVDLVEPSAHLLAAAKQRLSGRSSNSLPKQHKAVNFFQMGLQQFMPEPQRYDVIWVQWALLYLTDDDAVAFFQRCMDNLKPGGLIFVKENICGEGFVVDNDDASVTRSHQYMVELFDRAGLHLMHTALQKNFPKGLFKGLLLELGFGEPAEVSANEDPQLQELTQGQSVRTMAAGVGSYVPPPADRRRSSGLGRPSSSTSSVPAAAGKQAGVTNGSSKPKKKADPVSTYQAMQKLWAKDKFLKAGGDGKIPKRKTEGFRQLFSHLHAIEAAKR
ncbi:hypothetical protein N2152v2_000851 [Parachlorella kessleri]